LSLQRSEEIGLPVVMEVLSVLKISSTYTWEIIGIYRAPNEDMLATERLAARTLPTRNLTKRSIVGGDLTLRQEDWNGDTEKASGFQAIVKNLGWDNVYTQVVKRPHKTRLAVVYLPSHIWKYAYFL